MFLRGLTIEFNLWGKPGNNMMEIKYTKISKKHKNGHMKS